VGGVAQTHPAKIGQIQSSNSSGDIAQGVASLIRVGGSIRRVSATDTIQHN
jgi:hypothetical protein